jgi:hypothetical protein
MQNDKDRLDIDLGFLEQARPREAETKAVSKYKFNWRNIIVIVGIIGGLFIWGSMSDNTSSSRTSHSTYTPPASNSGNTVSNGQFRCSSYDSQQADLLSPANEFEIQNEAANLKQRGDELDALSYQIKTSTVNQSSPQYLIDSYNGMIDSYNYKLTAYKTDSSTHEQKLGTFNAQVEAHNNYLVAHCRRAN